MVQTSLRYCAGWPVPSMFACAISAIFSKREFLFCALGPLEHVIDRSCKREFKVSIDMAFISSIKLHLVLISLSAQLATDFLG